MREIRPGSIATSSANGKQVPTLQGNVGRDRCFTLFEKSSVDGRCRAPRALPFHLLSSYGLADRVQSVFRTQVDVPVGDRQRTQGVIAEIIFRQHFKLRSALEYRLKPCL